MPITIQWISAFVLIITSVLLVYDLEWQVNAGLLGLQFFAVFIMLLVFWPLNLSGSFFITSWVSILILTISLNQSSKGTIIKINFLSFEKIFHLLTALLLLVVIMTSYKSLANWFPSASSPLLISSLSLIFLGFLTIAFAKSIERILTGLLSFLAGFEITFTQVDNSILMVTLVCSTILLLTLIGTYLLQLEEQIT